MCKLPFFDAFSWEKILNVWHKPNPLFSMLILLLFIHLLLCLALKSLLRYWNVEKIKSLNTKDFTSKEK
jgi:isoprenylcysteine carboxyl methyltransferase (ICMT) family protein YpbQ